jgi:antitoxin (DNA-binding transcriptional repressor) of toxin-antitoxin stability system
METVGSVEARTILPQLLERVAKGEEFTITEQGKAVARLLPPHSASPERDVRQVIEELKEFSKGNTLGDDLTIPEMIEEGRMASAGMP